MSQKVGLSSATEAGLGDAAAVEPRQNRATVAAMKNIGKRIVSCTAYSVLAAKPNSFFGKGLDDVAAPRR